MGGPVWYFIWLSPLSFDRLRMSGCWLSFGERQDLRIVVSIRPWGARNYFTYFWPCTQYVVSYLRAGSDSPGDTSGAKPFPSQVFERRLPPGPVAILKLTGVGRRCFGPASLISGCKHVFYLDESRIVVTDRYGQRRGVSVFGIREPSF